jgi:Flp pilus assembly protein TadG
MNSSFVKRIAANLRFRAGRRQRGVVAITVGFSLVMLLGVGAFAIDIGRLLVVKNELQNAADAAALAGASYLMPTTAAGEPNWALATQRAGQAVSMNVADGSKLVSGTVTPAWWDFAARAFDPNTMRAAGSNDLPAIRVTIAKADGQNAGPVATTFGRVLGVDSLTSSATATAVISKPQAVSPEGMMPIALSACLFGGSSWNSGTEKSVIVASGAANGNHCNGCACGQWTTFNLKKNDVNTVRKLIESDPDLIAQVGDVSLQDETHITPGTKTTLYKDLQDFLGKSVNKTFTFPIVSNDDC